MTKLLSKPAVLFAFHSLLACTAPPEQLEASQLDPDVERVASELSVNGIRVRWIDVAGYFTDRELRFDARDNPNGIFVSPDADASSASDARARQELVALGAAHEHSRVFYLEAGDRKQPTVVLFHGIPDWSLMWRDVIPRLATRHHVIAFDQLGQGLSQRHASLTYTYKQQLAHTEAFFQAVGLDRQKVALVVHDTGGGLGLAYAARHPDRVSGIALFETVLGPVPSFEVMPLQAQFFRTADGQRAILEDNAFVENLIARADQIVVPNDRPFRVKPFSQAEILALRTVYGDTERRRALAQWVLEIPIMGGARDGHGDANLDVWSNFSAHLMTSTVPKLFLYASPGVLNSAPTVDFIKANMNVENSLTAIDLGVEGYHFLQADYPDAVGAEIAHWLDRIEEGSQP